MISEQPWDGAASRFTPEQWKASCIIHLDDSLDKNAHKLPIKEPSGALSRAAVHAAASRINQVDAPAEKVASAKASLRSAYKTLGEDPPDSIRERPRRRTSMSQTERRMGATVLEVRDNDSEGLTLTGYASTFNEPYSMGWYQETVDPGAFKRTLGRKPDVRLLINHADLPLARTTSGTLELDTDKRGLRVKTILDPSDPDVARLAPKMKRGDVNQMSFAFRIDGTDGDEWAPDFSTRTLRSLDLDDGDVSVVTYPANPNAAVGLRAAGPNVEAVTRALATLEQRGASDAEVVSILTRALAYFRGEPEPADEIESDIQTDLEPTRDALAEAEARLRALQV